MPDFLTFVPPPLYQKDASAVPVPPASAEDLDVILDPIQDDFCWAVVCKPHKKTAL